MLKIYQLNKLIANILFLACLLVNVSLPAQNKKHKTSPPNVVFILVDDMGWKDVGYQGSDYYLTPNVDKLATSGVRFTNAYAANPVCSPTRASIMTGRDPADKHVNITNWIGAEKYENRIDDKVIQPHVADHLPLDEFTMGEAFQKNGYSTYFVGKWHLGETAEYWPEHQGFDVNVAGWSKGNPGSYFAPYHNPRLDDGPDGEYLPFRLAREVLGFIDTHEKENPEKPFLMYLSMYNVHTPIEAPKNLVQRFEERRIKMGLPEKGTYETDKGVKNRTNQSDPTYAAMVWAMDSVVGMMENKLHSLGIADNTAIVFFSDNGGLSAPGYGVTTNRPLRGGKGWVTEGGIREPLIISYPPLTDNSKNKVVDEPVISYDFYPTLLDLAGLPLEPEQHTSGKSLLPLLKGKHIKKRNLYWHYPHYSPQGGTPASAIRIGKWKLIHFYEDNSFELYNLENDISESKNIASTFPEKVQEMSKDLNDYLVSIGASYPVPKIKG